MIKRVFPILSISVFSSMLGAGIISPLLPIYAESLGATGIWIGVIFAGFSISRAIFMPIIGRASDRRGRRKIFLCIGLFAYALISLGYVWANSVSDLTLIRLFHGSAAGMIIPIAQAYVGDLSPEGEEGTWMGYFNAAFFTGFGFGPLMGGVLTDHFGMNTAFYTMGALNLLAFTLALSPLPEVHQKGGVRGNPQTSFSQMMESGMIRGLVSFRLINALGRGAFSCFLPIFAGSYLGLTPTQIGAVLAINILLMALLQPFCGRLADRFSKRKLVIIGSLIDLITLSLVPLMQDFPQLVALCIFGSISRALALPAASGLTVEEGRKYGMGSAMGIFTMAMSLGMAGGPIISGQVYDSWGISSVFFIGACFSLLGTWLFIWFTKGESTKSLSEKANM
jgi:MFS family permease